MMIPKKREISGTGVLYIVVVDRRANYQYADQCNPLTASFRTQGSPDFNSLGKRQHAPERRQVAVAEDCGLPPRRIVIDRST
jgi:hypothetical protein